MKEEYNFMFDKEKELELIKNRISENEIILDSLEDGLEAVGYRLAIKKLKNELKALEDPDKAMDAYFREHNNNGVSAF